MHTDPMKAIVHYRYGPPEVAQIAYVPRPVPLDDEVLVRVCYSTVNRTDAGFRSAEYVISRFWSGLLKPKRPILGSEFSGVIADIGKLVHSFQIGDCVFGYNDITFGGHGAYMTIKATDAIAHIPDNITLDNAAALTEGAHYALCNIRSAKVRAGQHVLVYGATGAIGSAAVQLLRHFGARVTAVCGTQYVPLVTSLGAETVIDYQTQDFTDTHERYDFIFDAVGKSSFRACKPLLTERGVYISTELGKRGINILLALTTAFSRGRRLLFPIPSISRDDILLIKKLVEDHQFTPLIDRQYDMDDIVAAYTYVASGQKVGNVLLKIEEN